MRYWVCGVLFVFLLFSLAGCGLAGSPSVSDEIMEYYSGGGEISAEAEICFTGEYSLLSLVLSWQGTAEESVLTVTAPETLAGTVLHVEDGLGISQGDTALYTGHIGVYPQSPVTLLPHALSLWQTGYMTDCTRDRKGGREAVGIRQSDGEGATLYTWFDKETHLPFYLEWVYNEKIILSASLGQVSFTPAPVTNTK